MAWHVQSSSSSSFSTTKQPGEAGETVPSAWYRAVEAFVFRRGNTDRIPQVF